MRVYFSTVVRCSPVDQGGEVICLDWETKRILNRTPIRPTNPSIDDPNPRGNSRGGRGIHVHGDEVVAASYHTLRVFDRDLRPKRDISNGLMVGVHEVHAESDSRLWVASTAIDAALEIDLRTNGVLRQVWPRESPAFQKALDLEPLRIDKQVDNRTQFLSSKHLESRSHLHLNALASWNGEIYALFSAHGVIANLNTGRIVVKCPELKGAHNLLIESDGVATVNDTRRRKVRKFDVRTGTAGEVIDLTAFAWVRRLVNWHELGRLQQLKRGLARLVKGAAGKVGIKLTRSASLPLFVRGLDRAGDLLFVGVSPASILCIDERRKELVDGYTYSCDVNSCVHGLKVLRD